MRRIDAVILVKKLHQTRHREDIDTHRGEHVLGIARNARRVLRLLKKGQDAVSLIYRQYAEGTRLIEADC